MAASTGSADTLAGSFITIITGQEKIRRLLNNTRKMLSRRVVFIGNERRNLVAADAVVEQSAEDEYTIKNYNNSNIHIKIYPQHVTSSNKIQDLTEFIAKYTNNHKIIITLSITSKIESQLLTKGNLEIFLESFLMIDILDSVYQPTFQLLSSEEKIEFMKSYNASEYQLSKILIGDPVIKYMNAKLGDVFRIERYSEISGKAITYRIVSL